MLNKAGPDILNQFKPNCIFFFSLEKICMDMIGNPILYLNCSCDIQNMEFGEEDNFGKKNKAKTTKTNKYPSPEITGERGSG